MNPFVLFIFLGIFVGSVSGLFGIGGGVIMVPALLFAMEEMGVSSQHAIYMATRTSLGVILFTSLYSSWNHHQKAPLNKKILGELILFVVMGTLIGTFFVRGIPPEILETILMVYVSLIALKMWFGFRVNDQADSKPTRMWNFVIGNIIGFKSAILGIGGGTISVPYLTWKKVPLTQAVGISAAIGFVIALTGSLVTLLKPLNTEMLPPYTYGYIYVPGVLGVLSTSLIFSKIGTHYAHKIPQEKLRKGFALILFIVSIKNIIKFISDL